MGDFDRKYGVAFDEEMAEDIERFLSEGDSRSARIRNLVKMGLVAEKEMLDRDYWPPDSEKRVEIVSEAVGEYMDDMLA